MPSTILIFISRFFSIHIARACLKNHFRNLQAPLCGIFCPHSVAVARYAALIRIKSPTNWDSQFTKSLFQTRSRQTEIESSENIRIFLLMAKLANISRFQNKSPKIIQNISFELFSMFQSY